MENTQHKQKVSHFSANGLKKEEFRMNFAYSHTFFLKIQITTNSHRAWAACGLTWSDP